MIKPRRIGIVGTGHVGAAAAYALFVQQVASEIVLVDLDRERAEGEAMDLMHAQALAGRTEVRAGGYEDLAGAQLVVVTAGVSQKDPSESRLALLQRNAQVFQQIVAQLDRHACDAILLVATNPVDVLTYVTQRLSQRVHQRVIGTGTLLDTSRFRALLGRYYGVDPRSVHAYILGEHGDSEVPLWSTASVGSAPLWGRELLGTPFDEAKLSDLFEEARDAAYAIIERKGYTNTAIGVVIARIAKALLNDERAVLPVSVRAGDAYGLGDVCLSLPTLLGRTGAEGRALPPLSEDEHAALHHSASVLRESLDGLYA
jgi:L-lactate dehydrogenase